MNNIFRFFCVNIVFIFGGLLVIMSPQTSAMHLSAASPSETQANLIPADNSSDADLKRDLDKFKLLAENNSPDTFQLGLLLVPELLKSENIDAQTDILFQIADLAYMNGQLTEGLNINKAILAHAQQAQIKELAAKAEHKLGNGHYYQGEFELAIEFYNRAKFNYGETNRPLLKANSMTNLGIVYAQIGDLEYALEHYQAALKTYNDHQKHIDGADVLLNISSIHIKQLEFDKARKDLSELITLYQEQNDQTSLATVWVNMAITYSEEQRFSQAEHYFDLALSVFNQQKNYYDSCLILFNLAENNVRQGNFGLANSFARQVLEISEKNGFQEYVVHANYLLARISYQLEQYEQFLEAGNNALIQAKRLKMYEIQVWLIEHLSLTAQKLALDQQAVEYLKALIEVQEEWRKQQVKSSVAIYKARLDAAQYEHKLNSLRQYNQTQALLIETNQLQRNVILAVFVASVIIIALVYNRQVQKKITHSLEVKVAERTSELKNLNALHLTEIETLQQKSFAEYKRIRTSVASILGLSSDIASGKVSPEHLPQELQDIRNKAEDILTVLPSAQNSRLFANSQLVEINNLQTEYTHSKKIPAVLYVESESSTAKMIMRCLSPYRLKLTFSDNMEQAYQHVQDQKFDLILVGDGDCSSSIKQIIETLKHFDPHNSILLTSFHIQSGYPEQVINMGADGVIILPVTENEFTEYLSHFILMEKVKPLMVKTAGKSEHYDLVTEFKLSLSETVKKIRLGFGNSDYPELTCVCDKLEQSARAFGFLNIAEASEQVISAIKQGKESLIQAKTDALIDSIQVTLNKPHYKIHI